MDDETVFDGAAISQADREFLESLDDHPLRRDPRYGTPDLFEEGTRGYFTVKFLF